MPKKRKTPRTGDADRGAGHGTPANAQDGSGGATRASGGVPVDHIAQTIEQLELAVSRDESGSAPFDGTVPVLNGTVFACIAIAKELLVRKGGTLPETGDMANVVIVDPNGERRVMWNNQELGRLMINPDNTVGAYRYTGVSYAPGTPGYTNMREPWQGNYATQQLAILALMAPPPPGFVP